MKCSKTAIPLPIIIGYASIRTPYITYTRFANSEKIRNFNSPFSDIEYKFNDKPIYPTME